MRRVIVVLTREFSHFEESKTLLEGQPGLTTRRGTLNRSDLDHRNHGS